MSSRTPAGTRPRSRRAPSHSDYNTRASGRAAAQTPAQHPPAADNHPRPKTQLAVRSRLTLPAHAQQLCFLPKSPEGLSGQRVLLEGSAGKPGGKEVNSLQRPRGL